MRKSYTKEFFVEDMLWHLDLCHKAHRRQPGDFSFVDFEELQVLMTEDSFNFAGSNELADWFRNVDTALVPNEYGPGLVHQGFKRLSEKAWRLLTKFGYLGKPIKVAGHSAGAAVAALFAYRWVKMGGRVESLYLFACPKLGDEKFVEDFESSVQYLHVVNGKDLVHTLPWKVEYEMLHDTYFIGREGLRAWLEAFLMPKKVHKHETYIKEIQRIYKQGLTDC